MLIYTPKMLLGVMLRRRALASCVPAVRARNNLLGLRTHQWIRSTYENIDFIMKFRITKNMVWKSKPRKHPAHIPPRICLQYAFSLFRLLSFVRVPILAPSSINEVQIPRSQYCVWGSGKRDSNRRCRVRIFLEGRATDKQKCSPRHRGRALKV